MPDHRERKQRERAAAGGSADGAAAPSPAAATSRSAAPRSLSQQSTPVGAARQQLAAAGAMGQVAERASAAAGTRGLDGYTQASASAGSAQRKAIKVRVGVLRPRVRRCVGSSCVGARRRAGELSPAGLAAGAGVAGGLHC